MFRYRLRTLLIVMSLAAVVCLGLRAPSFLWSAGIFSVLVLALLTSALVAIYRSGQARAMALGFCVFAGGYLILEDQVWPGTVAVALPTGDLIRWSFDKLHRPSKTVPAHDPFGSPPPPAADDPFAPDPLSQRFYDYKGICIASLAFVVGLLGATIAQFLERTRNARAH